MWGLARPVYCPRPRTNLHRYARANSAYGNHLMAFQLWDGELNAALCLLEFERLVLGDESYASHAARDADGDVDVVDGDDVFLHGVEVFASAFRNVVEEVDDPAVGHRFFCVTVAMVLLAKLWRRSGWGRRRTPRVQEKRFLPAGRIFCLYWVEMGFFASPGSVQDPRILCCGYPCRGDRVTQYAERMPI